MFFLLAYAVLWVRLEISIIYLYDSIVLSLSMLIRVIFIKKASILQEIALEM